MLLIVVNYLSASSVSTVCGNGHLKPRFIVISKSGFCKLEIALNWHNTYGGFS